MALITYIEPEGTEHTVDVAPGLSVMQGALQELIPGIDADCGGAGACATCHVHVSPSWQERVGPPSENEEVMLEFVNERDQGSRLSCQIAVTEELNGLVVKLPQSQR